jgi:hypothetical protein
MKKRLAGNVLRIPMVRMIVVVACSLAVLSVGATAQDLRVSDDRYAELQKKFAEAYKPGWHIRRS